MATIQQVLTKEEVVAETRARVPVHEARDRIKIRGLNHDKYFYRLADMSRPDKIEVYLDAGYQFVTKGGSMIGDRTVRSTEGTGSIHTIPGGAGKTLGLMAIPLEFYRQDEKTKDNIIKQREEGMRKSLQANADPRIAAGLTEFNNTQNSGPKT